MEGGSLRQLSRKTRGFVEGRLRRVQVGARKKPSGEGKTSSRAVEASSPAGTDSGKKISGGAPRIHAAACGCAG